MCVARESAVLSLTGTLLALGLAVSVTRAQAPPPPTPASNAALRARIATLPATPLEAQKPTPGATITPARPVTEWKVGPVDSVTKGSPQSAETSFKARYVQLPPREQRETNVVLDHQLRDLNPARAEVPAFVQFNGAVVTQTKEATEVTLVPIVMVDDPLRFNAGTNRYEGSIAVGLVELGFKGPSKALSAGFNFQVFGDARTDPEMAIVSATAPPFVAMRVFADNPRDRVELQVVSNMSPDPVPLSLPVQRANLMLKGKQNLQGWGLESAEVTVSASDGSASKGQVVLLEAPVGNLSPEQLQLDSNGTAHASLRSESIGSAMLTASSNRLAPASETFNFEFPLRFLLAAIVGGVVGGLLRRGMAGAGRPLFLELLLSVLAGAVGFGLFTLGVNLTGFQLPRNGGEVLVAVVAALFAVGGTAMLLPKGPAA